MFQVRRALSGKLQNRSGRVSTPSCGGVQRVAGPEGRWNPIDQSSNPCATPQVESYLTCASKEQKRVGLVESYLTCASEEQKRGGFTIMQAEPLLAYIPEQLRKKALI